MCLILACIKRKPEKWMLEAAERTNRDGAGIAWIDNGQVRWIKGLNAEGIYARTQSLPLPFIIHFRFATVGPKTVALCHPFPIEENVRIARRGVAPRVLMHNGHWTGWDSICKKIGLQEKGDWSDTRAMAWLVAHFGDKVLHMIPDQKVAVLSKKGVRLFGKGWEKKHQMWASNTYSLTEPTTVVAGSGYNGYEGYGVYEEGAGWSNRSGYQNDYRTRPVKGWTPPARIPQTHYPPAVTAPIPGGGRNWVGVSWSKDLQAWTKWNCNLEEWEEVSWDCDKQTWVARKAIVREVITTEEDEKAINEIVAQYEHETDIIPTEVVEPLPAIEPEEGKPLPVAMAKDDSGKPTAQMDFNGMTFVRATEGGWLQVGPQQLKEYLRSCAKSSLAFLRGTVATEGK